MCDVYVCVSMDVCAHNYLQDHVDVRAKNEMFVGKRDSGVQCQAKTRPLALMELIGVAPCKAQFVLYVLGSGFQYYAGIILKVHIAKTHC